MVSISDRKRKEWIELKCVAFGKKFVYFFHQNKIRYIFALHWYKRIILTVRFLITSTSSWTAEFLWFAATWITYQQCSVVLDKNVFQFLLWGFINVCNEKDKKNVISLTQNDNQFRILWNLNYGYWKFVFNFANFYETKICVVKCWGSSPELSIRSNKRLVKRNSLFYFLLIVENHIKMRISILVERNWKRRI